MKRSLEGGCISERDKSMRTSNGEVGIRRMQAEEVHRNHVLKTSSKQVTLYHLQMESKDHVWCTELYFVDKDDAERYARDVGASLSVVEGFEVAGGAAYTDAEGYIIVTERSACLNQAQQASRDATSVRAHIELSLPLVARYESHEVGLPEQMKTALPLSLA